LGRLSHHAAVLTLRSAAQLLARAESLDALRPLARALGYVPSPAPLTAALRRELGIDALTSRAELHAGAGTLTLLAAQLSAPDGSGESLPAFDLRERTRQLASALLRHAPRRHWCLCTIDDRGTSLCLATVSDGGGTARIAALRVHRERVLDSDADTVRALAAVTETDPAQRHARFADILRRDALSLRFYRELERSVHTLAQSLAPSARTRLAHPCDTEERRELALLATSRCLFLAFLEAKGWLDNRRDFLLHHVLRLLETGGALHTRLLRPLFFGTLNTPRAHRAPAALAFGNVPFLNGGLFAPTRLEQRHRQLHFSDDALTAFITGVLDRYRFTAHEDSSAWSEAAVDPEMLGRAFECLMAPQERRRSGSFYTPPQLVSVAVQQALEAAIPELPETLLTDAGLPLRDVPLARTLHTRLSTLRILDPACGSGAFLVHMLESIDRLLAATGDTRDAHTRRRDILLHTIFGVDRHPMAVWLCELRLWLSVVIECHETDGAQVPPLPNLDHHIRIGDSLAGGSFRFAPPAAASLTRLRTRYARASGPRKQAIATALDGDERQRTLAEIGRRLDATRRERHALLVAMRTRDLFGQRRATARADRARLQLLRSTSRELTDQQRRLSLGGALPFRFAAMFADVAARGGFDLIIGNPPWVRPHAMTHADRQRLRLEFRTMREAAWSSGATRAGAGAGFAAQADLAVAFVERSVQLLAPHGVLALLVPAKLWRTLSGGGVRRLLLSDTRLHALLDWSDAPAQFEAATYPSLVVARCRQATDLRDSAPVRIAITRQHTVRFSTPLHTLSLDGEAGAPWILLPSDARAAFERLRRAGTPLAATPLGRPLLGVKCGCNAAFVVHAVEHDDDSATITSLDSGAARQGVIERTLLRPALRGEAIGALRARRLNASTPTSTRQRTTKDETLDTRIVWTHAPDGAPLRILPPAGTRWLAQWRPRLQHRRDARSRQPWWTLFRTEAARYDMPRVVWADIGRRLRTQVIPAGDPTVPLNSCYVLRVPTLDDAWALHALLHSTITAAWLDALAEPARGGFRRFLGWTVAALPIPHDWPAAVKTLAPLGRALHATHADDLSAIEVSIDDAVIRAFGLERPDVQPLLDWYHP
jgi:hypothetical protein